MKLPISVIIPYSAHRDSFFYRFALPSIEGCQPAEIIIESGDESAPTKRNRGAEKATQPYLFFCDDDTILANDCLKKMYDTISNGQAQFCYCDYLGIVSDSEAHPLGKNYVHIAQDFDPSQLRKHNYIDTMSLLSAESFPGFDEELEGYQDWDLWLTIAERGGRGIFIDDVLYMTFHFGSGISSNIERLKKARKYVQQKHGLS